jgi:PAS domain S-box-containing protein
MRPYLPDADTAGVIALQVLWEDGDRVFYRAARDEPSAERRNVMVVLPATENGTSASPDRLAHEYALKDHLDAPWAVRPLDLLRDRGRTMLVLDDPGASPLHRILDAPMDLSRFLPLATALAAALRGLHERGLIHKDINPANVLVSQSYDQVWLTGFGVTSRLPRERQEPAPPEFIAGTLPYMAPEQTGRMNRSIDSRTDLYALGVTFYQMLTGMLPFTATDPMAWVHCHIARTPAPPRERLGTIPVPVSHIVMKLLAKTAEERYQTAAGLEHDLQQCQDRWDRDGRLDEFPLALHDVPDRLLIPEKLYGRTRDVTALLSSFQRVAATGTPELVLISGYSGIGKSSVVNELHKVLVPLRGLFASGKFDQYKRDIPYATLAHAFQTLVRQILGKSEAELRHWRDALHEALGRNGLLMVDLIPQLQLVIGEQAPVPELSPQDAQRRFQRVLRQFIGVFARPEHPLALFLDDLQWLDAATIDFLEDLLAQQDTRHLLLIGAYRDNEVNFSHPLMRSLETIRQSCTAVLDIVLAPLNHVDLKQLIVESLHCDANRTSPLVQLVHEKTAGNPFFIIQFLHALADEALLIFDHREARWVWDLDRIHAKGYTENVVDLMVIKLNRLPAETQTVLRQLACLGPSADLALLATVCQTSQETLLEDLWEAVRSGLVQQSENTCEFEHDRVQEAAYSQIAEQERAETHLQIGRLLVAYTAQDKREEVIFEIVSHFNRSILLITSRNERRQLAEFNLIAGKRAKNAIAYSSALTHFTVGRALLADECWTQQYPLAFELEFHLAECKFLTGDSAGAEERLASLSSSAANLVDLAAVTCLRAELYQVLGRPDRAVAVCLDYLRRVGVEWSPHPTAEDVRLEYERIWQQIGSRTIEDLIDLPLMNDAATRATMDVLTKVMPSTQCTDDKLLCLIITRMVNLSLATGNCNASCCGYVWFGLILSSYFDHYPAARRFGRLSLDLVERRGLDAFKARVYEAYGIFVSPWAEHVRSGRPFVQRAFSEANKIGDLTYASYCCNNFVTISLASGEPLGEVDREAREGIDFAQKADFGLVVDIIRGQLCLIRTLRGRTANFNSFDDAELDERKFEQHLEADPNLAIAACWYWIRKLQARVFAQDYLSALEAAAKAQPLLWTSPAFFEQAEYHFYVALAQAGSMDADAFGSDQRSAHLEALTAHCRQIRAWADHCPENFENRSALVGAELARLKGSDTDAGRLYDQAIRSARANGFVHNEALACELAGRFYMARGFEDIGQMYLLRARNGYLRWGADGKVRQLEMLHPRVAAANLNGWTRTTASADQQLDVATIVKASQALSSEMLLPRLIERLMTIALQSAGADRGLLILLHQNDFRIEAEARTDADGIVHHSSPGTGLQMPESMIRYVIRTQESVILEDAAKQNLFSEDPYLSLQRVRSVLCLPIVRQGVLGGLLYLENKLASHVFAPDRATLIELLASQAAISLENTRLYSDLQEREARVRRLVDSNIIGIFIWDLEGPITDANEAFLRLAGRDRHALEAGEINWRDMTPAEWAAVDDERLAELKTTGVTQTYEKEIFAKNGSRVPVLVGGAIFNGTRDEGVTFVVDLTDRNRAETSARESEHRYHEIQLQLAHANRVETLGHLSASIAHELNQPLSGAVTSAETALLWLTGECPNLPEAQEALTRVIRDGNRASQVFHRIRSLIKRAPTQKDDLDINEVTLEIVGLTHGEAAKDRVEVRTQLQEGLPLIRADRVQLQQVILNLVMNALDAIGSLDCRRRDILISTANTDAGDIRVSVQDWGPGVDQTIIDRMFDAFFTTKPNGLGMGLSICRSIVEAHGGKLWATSGSPCGAIIQFTIPAIEDG